MTFYYPVRSVFTQLTIEICSDNVDLKVQISRRYKLKLDWKTSPKDMPQFWIAIFFILLAVSELYQSIKDIDLPLPVYLGLGTILAIASNYQQQFSFAGNRQIIQQPTITAEPVLSSTQTPLLVATKLQDLD